MVIAAVDDILFRSRIAAAAAQQGVEVVFAASPADLLEKARQLRPSLVIFDLGSIRMDATAAVTMLKEDPLTAAIPTIGFVAHVRTDLIEGARLAGVRKVMARSAFVAALPDILREAAPPARDE
jgi:CheY-like chemotaxis protein